MRENSNEMTSTLNVKIAEQIQGFFDLPVDHLAAAPVFYKHLEEYRDTFDDLIVVSPDVGNVKIANQMIPYVWLAESVSSLMSPGWSAPQMIDASHVR